MFNFSSTVQDDAALFDQFGDELQESGSLEFVQVINAGGKIAKTLEKNPLAYGFALNKENAESIDFAPTADWVQGEDIPIHPLSKATIESGYVARNVNVVVLNSSDLEVQQKVDDRWRFMGVAYDKGQHTAAGQSYESRKDDKDSPYRQIRRYLLLFLGYDGQPLHAKPVQFTAKGAFGYSFNQEIQSFQKELGSAYRDAYRAGMQHTVMGNKISGSLLSKAAQAYTVIPMSLGFHIPDEADRSAYTCIVARMQPVLKPSDVGQKAVLKRRDRNVDVTGALWSGFMIPKGSELGHLITDLCQEHASFGEPNRGMGASEPIAEGVDIPYTGTGFFNAASLQTVDGKTFVGFVTDAGEVPLDVPAELMEMLDAPRAQVQGFVPAEGGPIVVTGWTPVAFTPVSEVESSLVANF
jgi:hypothetical protein